MIPDNIMGLSKNDQEYKLMSSQILGRTLPQDLSN
jgi:hypothetical protein